MTTFAINLKIAASVEFTTHNHWSTLQFVDTMKQICGDGY